MEAMTINQLVAARVTAKRVEDAAATTRKELDEQIATLLRPTDKLEGTVSEVAGEFKISVTYKLTRSVNTPDLQKAWDKLSTEQQGAIKWKADLSVTEFRKLDDKDQLKLSAFVEAKPASPTIKIEAA